MVLNFKRRRIMQGREEAVVERRQATRDFLAAIREAEAALEAFKAANDKLYLSDVQHEYIALKELRQTRERMFSFVTAKDVVAEAPYLARLLGVKVAPTQAPPLIEWVDHVSQLDLATAKGT